MSIALLQLSGWLLPERFQHVHDILIALGSLPGAWKLLAVYSVVVLAPLTEEIFFRGLVQSMLRRYVQNAWPAILLTSAMFALMHMQNPQDVLSLFAFGVALGYNYERCGRLYVPILMHGIFNAVSITIWLAASGQFPVWR